MSKKLIRTEWLESVNELYMSVLKEQRERAYISGKGNTNIRVKLYVRDDKILMSYKKYLSKNYKNLIANGWDIGERRINLFKKNFHLTIIPNRDILSIEIVFDFNSDDNLYADIIQKSEIVENALKSVLQLIPNAKITMDISYTVGKDVNIDIEKIIPILIQANFKQNSNCKNSLRKFTILKNRNVTTYINVKSIEEYTEVSLRVDEENIIVNLQNIKDEIINSTYFYFLNYIDLNCFFELTQDNNTKCHEKLKKQGK